VAIPQRQDKTYGDCHVASLNDRGMFFTVPCFVTCFFFIPTSCGEHVRDTQDGKQFTKNFQNCNIRAVFLSYNPKRDGLFCSQSPKNAIKSAFFEPNVSLFFYRKILLLCNHYESNQGNFRFDMKKAQEIFKKRLHFSILLCKMYMR